MKKSLLALVILLFACSGFVFTACNGNSHGIPNGEYYPINESGEITTRDFDFVWRIDNNRAAIGRGFFYTEWKITQENDKIYFDWISKYNITYEVNYDESTKILTVYSLSNDGTLKREGNGSRYLKESK